MRKDEEENKLETKEGNMTPQKQKGVPPTIAIPPSIPSSTMLGRNYTIFAAILEKDTLRSGIRPGVNPFNLEPPNPSPH